MKNLSLKFDANYIPTVVADLIMGEYGVSTDFVFVKRVGENSYYVSLSFEKYGLGKKKEVRVFGIRELELELSKITSLNSVDSISIKREKLGEFYLTQSYN